MKYLSEKITDYVIKTGAASGLKSNHISKQKHFRKQLNI